MKQINWFKITNWCSYIFIGIIILNAALLVLGLGYQVILKPDQISTLRVDIPWFRPAEDVTIMLHQQILENNPELNEHLSKQIMTHDLIERLLLNFFLVLIIIHVKTLITSIYKSHFFNQQNLKNLKSLSLSIFGLLIAKSFIYHLISVFSNKGSFFSKYNLIY